MTQDVLDVVRFSEMWRVAWRLSRNGSLGAFLGDVEYTVNDLIIDGSEHIVATLAVESLVEKRDAAGYGWSSRGGAERARRAAVDAVDKLRGKEEPR